MSTDGPGNDSKRYVLTCLNRSSDRGPCPSIVSLYSLIWTLLDWYTVSWSLCSLPEELLSTRSKVPTAFQPPPPELAECLSKGSVSPVTSPRRRTFVRRRLPDFPKPHRPHSHGRSTTVVILDLLISHLSTVFLGLPPQVRPRPGDCHSISDTFYGDLLFDKHVTCTVKHSYHVEKATKVRDL